MWNSDIKLYMYLAGGSLEPAVTSLDTLKACCEFLWNSAGLMLVSFSSSLFLPLAGNRMGGEPGYRTSGEGGGNLRKFIILFCCNLIYKCITLKYKAYSQSK